MLPKSTLRHANRASYVARCTGGNDARAQVLYVPLRICPKRPALSGCAGLPVTGAFLPTRSARTSCAAPRGESLADGARDIGYSLQGIVSLQQRCGGSATATKSSARSGCTSISRRSSTGRQRPTIAPPGGFGSDVSFRTYRAYVFTFAPLGKELVLGGRLDGRAARGDVPFYQLPYIELRGIPAARYQDENTFVAEAELRWSMTHRWALVGFGGGGRVWGRRTSFSDVDTLWSKGLGFRYLLSRRMGIYAGLDYANGPEDHAIYIQVGSAWR